MSDYGTGTSAQAIASTAYNDGYTAGVQAERERVLGILEVYRPRGCDCRNCAEMDEIRRRVEGGE